MHRVRDFLSTRHKDLQMNRISPFNHHKELTYRLQIKHLKPNTDHAQSHALVKLIFSIRGAFNKFPDIFI